MLQQTTDRWRLAPCYIDLARDERGKLTPEHRRGLRYKIQRSGRDGIVTAWLHLIEREMAHIGMPRKELLARIPEVTNESTISKWFTRGRVQPGSLARLVKQPEFLHLEPTVEEAILHGWRECVTWVQYKVLSSDGGRRLIKYSEYILLQAVHMIDEPDVGEAFSQIPMRLLRSFPSIDANQVSMFMNEWGRSFRIFVMEGVDD